MELNQIVARECQPDWHGEIQLAGGGGQHKDGGERTDDPGEIVLTQFHGASRRQMADCEFRIAKCEFKIKETGGRDQRSEVR